jgi:alcohol dehydrogenase class IV
MRSITHARIAEMAFIARSLDPSLNSKPDADAASQAAELVEKLGAKIGIPKGLRALGVKKEQLPQLSQMASTVRRLLDNSPVPFDENDLLRLLREAF